MPCIAGSGRARELLTISDELSRLPAEGPELTGTLLDSFVDVDGEPLVERLLDLARVAQRYDRRISFQ